MQSTSPSASPSAPGSRIQSIAPLEQSHAKLLQSLSLQHPSVRASPAPCGTAGTCWSGRWCGRSRRGRTSARTASSPARTANWSTGCTPHRRSAPRRARCRACPRSRQVPVAGRGPHSSSSCRMLFHITAVSKNIIRALHDVRAAARAPTAVRCLLLVEDPTAGTHALSHLTPPHATPLCCTSPQKAKAPLADRNNAALGHSSEVS